MTPERKAKLILWLNTLTLLVGALTIFLVFRIIGTAATQTNTTQKQIVDSQKLTEKELRCLAAFFSRTNRESLRINNLEKCEIIHTDTGQTEVLPLQPTVNTSPSPAASEQNKNANSEKEKTNSGNQDQKATSQQSATSQAAPQVNGNADANTKNGGAQGGAGAGFILQPAITPQSLNNHTDIKVKEPKKLGLAGIRL